MTVFTKSASYQTNDGQTMDLTIENPDGAIRKYLTPDGKMIRRESFGQNDVEGTFLRDVKLDYAEMPDGKFIQKYNNGQTLHEETVQDGQRHGYARGFFADGSLSYDRGTKDGLLDGPFIVKHENGKTARQGNYVEGNLDGVIPHYDAAGKLIKVDSYSKGVPHGRQVIMKEGKEVVSYKDQGKDVSQLVWASKENAKDLVHGDIKSVINRITGDNKKRYEAFKM